jgi:hypothetical protein
MPPFRRRPDEQAYELYSRHRDAVFEDPIIRYVSQEVFGSPVDPERHYPWEGAVMAGVASELPDLVRLARHPGMESTRVLEIARKEVASWAARYIGLQKTDGPDQEAPAVSAEEPAHETRRSRPCSCGQPGEGGE